MFYKIIFILSRYRDLIKEFWVVDSYIDVLLYYIKCKFFKIFLPVSNYGNLNMTTVSNNPTPDLVLKTASNAPSNTNTPNVAQQPLGNNLMSQQQVAQQQQQQQKVFTAPSPSQTMQPSPANYTQV